MANVRGLSKIIANFEKHAKRLTETELKSKLQILATETAEQARKIVPVKTRELLRSIHATTLRTTQKGYQIEVKAEKYYAIFVELGTSKMRAQPFLSTGFKNAQRSVESIFKQLGLD